MNSIATNLITPTAYIMQNIPTLSPYVLPSSLVSYPVVSFATNYFAGDVDLKWSIAHKNFENCLYHHNNITRFYTPIIFTCEEELNTYLSIDETKSYLDTARDVSYKLSNAAYSNYFYKCTASIPRFFQRLALRIDPR